MALLPLRQVLLAAVLLAFCWSPRARASSTRVGAATSLSSLSKPGASHHVRLVGAEPHFCLELNKTLHKEHNCSVVSCDVNGPAGVVLECTDVKVVHEHFQIEVALDVCATPPSVVLNVTDRTNPKVHFVKKLSASGKVGVPGLSVDVDHVEVGLFIVYQVAVEADELEVELGAQLCGKIGPLHKCFPKHAVYFVNIKDSIKGLCDGQKRT